MFDESIPQKSKSRRRRLLPKVPVQLERLIVPAAQPLPNAIAASPEVQGLLAQAVWWWHISTESPEAAALSAQAVQRATALLMEDPAVQWAERRAERVCRKLGWLVHQCATGGDPSFQLPGSFEALWPGQRTREVVIDGRSVIDVSGVPPDELDAEIARLKPYLKWRAQQETGRTAKWQGKSKGDRRMSPRAFHDNLTRALRDYRGDRLRLTPLAGFMGMVRNTLLSYLGDPAYGPPWETLVHCRTLERCEKEGRWTRPLYHD